MRKEIEEKKGCERFRGGGYVKEVENTDSGEIQCVVRPFWRDRWRDNRGIEKEKKISLEINFLWKIFHDKLTHCCVFWRIYMALHIIYSSLIVCVCGRAANSWIFNCQPNDA